MKSMKILGIFLVASFLFLNKPMTVSAAIKTAEVDMQKVLISVDEGKAAQSKMENEFKKLEDNFKKKQSDYEKLLNSYQKQSSVLKDDAKKKKEDELRQRQSELMKEQQESSQKLQNLEQELQKPLIEKINTVVEEASKKEGVELTFIKGMTAPLYAADKKDLTEQVIKLYNQKHPVKK